MDDQGFVLADVGFHLSLFRLQASLDDGDIFPFPDHFVPVFFVGFLELFVFGKHHDTGGFFV